MSFRRKQQPSAMDQLRAELSAEFNHTAKWELRKHLEADHALALALSNLRGADLEHIREIVTDPRRTPETAVAQIREYMDNVW